EFYVYIKFNHENTSDCFTVTGNGQNYGNFNYANLPIKIGPLKGNCETNYEFVIRDCKNERCAIDGNLGKVCCETQGGDCKLSDLSFEKTPCNENKEFYVYIKFNHENTSDCFTVTGNGQNYGNFNYANLPIKIGPLKGNCETNYEFVIRDCKNERCAIDGNLGKVCCETQGGDCKLSDLSFEKTPCNENKEFYVYIKFNHENTSDCFTVTGNGQNYGNFNYANLPIKIGPLKGNCETNYEFVIRDCKNEKCSIEGVLGKVCCETGGTGDCNITDLVATRSDCKEGQFYVTLSFNHKNGSECFVVKQNDNTISKFLYSSIPVTVGPFKGDCKTEYTFTVYDCNNERCVAKTVLGKVCCETQGGGDCKLSDLKIEKSACTAEKTFYVTLNFNHQNTSECFTVSGNGQNYGNFNYANLPIKIGPLKGNCETNYEFVIRDCKNEQCAIDGNLGKVCCETQTGDCNITDLVATRTDCKEGQFFVKLSFNHKNGSECFVVKQNDNILGKFLYSTIPVLVGPFKGDCKTEYNFLVYDCNNERCQARVVLGKVCCETQGGDCKLSELKIEKSACNADKTFTVTINFNHNNTTECFMVQGNGINYGTFKYSQLPIKIGPLKGNCETNYEFAIRDCENEKCNLFGNLGKVCCESQELCELSQLEAVKGDCNDAGNFIIRINFKYRNVSECFIVRQNNNILGKFKYSSLPIELGPFKGDCTTNYVLSIADCENERCYLKKEIGKVCCKKTTDCMLSELKYEKTACDANRQFYLNLKFAHKNTSECFTVTGNGVNYGTFKYTGLPIKIGPLKGNCETKYEFVIRDCKNERCSLVLPLGVVCCEKLEADCQIENLQVRTVECTGANQYSVVLNFTSKGTKGVGFDVFDQSGKAVGFYPYTSLPLTIKDFKASGKEVDYLKVCENDNNQCCAETKFTALKCFKSNPGGFDVGTVELRYGIDQIIIHGEDAFPDWFIYNLTDIRGKVFPAKEIRRSAHDIVISTNNIIQGVYIIRIQNSYDLRNLKFVK
ncbi:MAG: hypothetical protein ABI851_12010, partial [Saprospiraceae bacterium]